MAIPIRFAVATMPPIPREVQNFTVLSTSPRAAYEQFVARLKATAPPLVKPLDDFEVLLDDVVVITGLGWRICRSGSPSRGVLVFAAARSSGSTVFCRTGWSARRCAHITKRGESSRLTFA